MEYESSKLHERAVISREESSEGPERAVDHESTAHSRASRITREHHTSRASRSVREHPSSRERANL